MRERASYAFALVSVAAALDLDDGGGYGEGPVVRDVRLALGGVSHKPHRAHRFEEVLRGAPATEESITAALDAELEAARPGEQNAYKVSLLRRTVVAVVRQLVEGGRR